MDGNWWVDDAVAIPSARMLYSATKDNDGERTGSEQPGRQTKWWQLNTFSIVRGCEGKWFPAWDAWENVARPASNPHPPQPPAPTLKRINRTRAEHRAEFQPFAKTRVRLVTSVTQDLRVRVLSRG
jgi:hypothetical protein